MLKSAFNLDIGRPGKVNSTPIWMRQRHVLNTIDDHWSYWRWLGRETLGRGLIVYFTRPSNHSTMRCLRVNCTTGSSLPRGSDQLELELGLSLNPSRSKTILLGTGFPFETEKERGCTQSNKLGHRAGLQLDDEDHCLHLRNRGQTTIELDFHWLVWRMRESYRSRQS